MPGARVLSQQLAAEGLPVTLLGAALDYDEDPAWVRGAFETLVSDWKAAAFSLTVLPSIANPAKWLETEAGEHAEDPRWEDFEALAQSFSLFLDVSHGGLLGAPRYRKRVPSMAGFLLLVGEPTPHLLTPAGALQMVRALAREPGL